MAVDILSCVLSTISLVVIVIVAVVLFINTAKYKEDTESTLQSIVKQVNDSQYYAYKFDTLQKANLKNMDDQLKKMKDAVISKEQAKQSISTNKVQIGNNFIFSGVDKKERPSDMLHLYSRDGSYSGGLSTGGVYVKDMNIIDGNMAATKLVQSSTFTSTGDDNGWNWMGAHIAENDRLYFGGDSVNRGIFDTGTRPFTIYKYGNPSLIVNDNVETNKLKIDESLCFGPSCLTENQLIRIKQGNYGPVGMDGIEGPVGQRGVKGPMGWPGMQGTQGNQGPQGLKGERGPQGRKGNTGPQGPPGVFELEQSVLTPEICVGTNVDNLCLNRSELQHLYDRYH